MNKKVHMVTFLLLIIGGLNWGLAIFGWDIGNWGFIPESVAMIVYALVALSAIYELATHKSSCRGCKGGEAPAAQPSNNPGAPQM